MIARALQASNASSNSRAGSYKRSRARADLQQSQNEFLAYRDPKLLQRNEGRCKNWWNDSRARCMLAQRRTTPGNPVSDHPIGGAVAWTIFPESTTSAPFGNIDAM